MRVGNIYLDPQNPAIVYANSYRWIHKSTDNGATWNVISPFDSELFLWGVSPQSVDTLYGSMEQSLFISTDGGANWRHIRDFGADIVAFVIDPRAPDIMYIGTEGGAFKSINGGESWSYIDKGLTGIITVLVMDPRDSLKLYIGTWGGDVFKSTDGGENWSQVVGGISDRRVLAITIDPLDSSVVYISFDMKGLYKSADGGGTWNRVKFDYSNMILSLAIDPKDPLILYAGLGGGGVYKSTDGGLTWKSRISGMGSQHIKALLINPEDTQKVYASGETVYRSTNGGNVWNTSGFAGNIYSIAIDPQNPDIIYAGSNSYAGIYKSTTGCSGFKQSGLGFVGNIYSIAIDPISHLTVYAAADRYIYGSTNGGDTWGITGMVDSSIRSLIIDPDHPSTLYAGTNSHGVFKSVDSGITWTAINKGLTKLLIYTLVMDPTNPQILYAGVHEGVFKSTDGGENWIYSGGLTQTAVTSLVINPANPNALFSAGGYRSDDGGLTWVLGAAPAEYVRALAINPLEPATLYAATNEGLYVSLNSGENWIVENREMPFLSAVISASSPDTLYVAGSGVFKRSTKPTASPNLTNLNPPKAIVGDAAFTLSVYGNRFSKDSVVRWNGAALTTAFVSSLFLRADVPATLLSSPGIAQITVDSEGTFTNSIEFAVKPSVPVTVTFDTNPTGLEFYIDWQPYYEAKSFEWSAESRHLVWVNSPIDYGPTMYTFSGWSDGGPGYHYIETPPSPTAYIASFNTLHKLTASVSPEGTGRIIFSQGSGGYYPSETPVGVSAIPNDGYTFVGWSGDLSGSTNPQMIVMSAPRSVTAIFAAPAPVSITVATNPAGRSFVVDGASYSAAQTFAWEQGSSHTISVASLQSGSSGTRYVFANWSDSGAMSHTITVPASATKYIANFGTQYLLTTSVSPQAGGSINVSPSTADGYYASGTSVQLTTTANSGYTFVDWSGSATGTTNPKTLTMTAPRNVTASFQLAGANFRPPRQSSPASNRTRKKRDIRSLPD